jgi:2-polyprenyl-3-methyl-5-hydroxy-6-metoxy-1,4-benzoquinol methylase
MVLTVTTLLQVDGLATPIKLREARDHEDVPLRTGCRVWSAAVLLSEWLLAQNRREDGGVGGGGGDDPIAVAIAGKDVLELGAGTGAVGLVCAQLGARSITLTDRDEATLSLMHNNAQINGHYDAAATCEVCVCGLDWGDLSTYMTHRFHVVVAADVLYLPEHCAALPAAAAAHLAPGGLLVVACGLRRAGLMERLVEEMVALGLSPNVDRRALALEEEGQEGGGDGGGGGGGGRGKDGRNGGGGGGKDARVRSAAAVTAGEHAHDGAQIAAAGGYVLVTARAPMVGTYPTHAMLGCWRKCPKRRQSTLNHMLRCWRKCPKHRRQNTPNMSRPVPTPRTGSRPSVSGARLSCAPNRNRRRRRRRTVIVIAIIARTARAQARGTGTLPRRRRRRRERGKSML